MRLSRLRLPLYLQLLLPKLAMLAVTILVGVLYLQSEWRGAVDRAENKSATTASVIANEIDATFRSYNAVFAELSVRPQIRSMTSGDCDPILTQFFSLHKELRAVSVRDVTGKLVCSSRPDATQHLPADLQPLFSRAVAADGFSVTGAIQGAPNREWIAAMTYPIRSDDNRIIGLILAPIDLKSFSDTIFATIPTDTIPSVLDGDLRVVLRSRDLGKWVGQQLPAQITSLYRHGGTGSFEARDLYGTLRIGSYTTVPTTGWIVALGYPEATVLDPIRPVIAWTAILGVLVVLFVVGVTLLLARNIADPIRALAQLTKRVAEGDLETRALTGGPKEVAEVGAQFNAMLEALKAYHEGAHRSAEIIRQNEERFRLLSQATSDVIFDWDAKAHEVWWSKGILDQFGYTVSSNVTDEMFFQELLSEHERKVVNQSFAVAVSSGQTLWREKCGLMRKDGSMAPVAVRANIIRGQYGEVVRVVGSLVDLTKIEKLEESLRQSQKLEAVGQLTGGIAHDFNNLLTVIVGNAEILSETLPPDSLERQLSVDLLSVATRGAELTSRLLAFARRQPLQPRLIRPRTVISGLRDLLRRTLDGKIELQTQCTDTWAAMIDPVQLETAIVNLAFNARDAMHDGGRLVIRSEDMEVGEGTLGPAGLPKGQYVEVTVADTGTGMSEEVMKRAFEPFFTTKPTGEGTGLGLSMVHGFAVQSGGIANIVSSVGVGTSVSIWFPRVVGQVEESRPARRVIRPATAHEHVLVVEDNKDVASYVARELSAAGYKVSCAGSGAEALDMLDSIGPFELLFTDLVMAGGMSGKDLGVEVTMRRPGVRVLYTSGYAENVFVHDGRLDRGVDLLQKPFNSSALLQRIRQALDQATDQETVGS